MAFKQAWTDSTLGATVSVTVSVAAGDVLIAWLVEDTNPGNDGNLSSNWPSGFTHVHAIDTFADGQVLSVGIKVADGTEGALTFGFPSGNDCIGGVAAFSGRDTTTPQDVAAVEISVDTAASSPWTVNASLTPVTDGCDLVAVMGSDVTAARDAVHSFSGGGLTWTTIADQWSGDFENVGVGHAVQATAGAITVTGTGTRNGTTAGRAMILLALKPAAGGGGGDATEVSATDGVLVPDTVTRAQAHTLRDVVLVADDDLRQTLTSVLGTDALLLLAAATIDGLTVLVTRTATDGVLLADTRESLLDRVLREGVLAADGVETLRDLRAADAMLLADTRRSTLDRVLTDAILTADLTVKLLALVAPDRLLLADTATPETAGGGTVVTRLATDTVLVADAVAREQALGRGDSVLLADATVRAILLTLAERLGLVDTGTATRGQDRTATDTVLLTDTVVRDHAVVQVDGVLLATLATRVRDLLWTEGFALTDTGTPAYLPPDVSTLTGIRVGVGDALGRTVVPQNLLGRTIGSLDVFARRLGAARVGVA